MFVPSLPPSRDEFYKLYTEPKFCVDCKFYKEEIKEVVNDEPVFVNKYCDHIMNLNLMNKKRRVYKLREFRMNKEFPCCTPSAKYYEPK